jgi:outer membrane protein OmpA-like peptidoglycan-associated protein
MHLGRTLLIAGLLGTAGCARTGISLLANEKGETGAVAVLDPKTGLDIVVLDTPNTRSGVSGSKPVSTKVISDAQMKGRYGDLLDAMPDQPRLFVLYFREGSVDLVDESNALVPELFEEMKRRPGVDVQVVGHTDTVGNPESNDALSVKRAEQVREMLVRLGMDLSIVRATGRGEREPLEPTGDEVASLFNRRVEVLVK